MVHLQLALHLVFRCFSRQMPEFTTADERQHDESGRMYLALVWFFTGVIDTLVHREFVARVEFASTGGAHVSAWVPVNLSNTGRRGSLCAYISHAFRINISVLLPCGKIITGTGVPAVSFICAWPSRRLVYDMG